MGREVWKSAKKHYSAGTYSVVWNGVNQSGQPVGTGMYIVRLKSPMYSATQKVLLMK
jgi:flagellar hook assembly protein FlgD